MANSVDGLPSIGITAIDEAHRADEAQGFGEQIVSALAQNGFSEVKYHRHGAFARLYLARDRNGERVAVRVQAPHARNKWRNKVSFMNTLRQRLLMMLLKPHSNLIHYKGFGVLRLKTDTDTFSVYYSSMPYIDGEPLIEAIKSPEFRAGGVARIGQQIRGILRGWSVLYSRGLRQGDLTPYNILVPRDTFEPVLIDLRFSTRFFKSIQRERKELCGTFQALLSGEHHKVKDMIAPLPPINREAAAKLWVQNGDAAPLKIMHTWADFIDNMDTNPAWQKLSPPELLRRAEHVQ